MRGAMMRALSRIDATMMTSNMISVDGASNDLRRAPLRDEKKSLRAPLQSAAAALVMGLISACNSGQPPTPGITASPSTSKKAAPTAGPAAKSGAFKLVEGSENKPVTNCESIFAPPDVVDIITGGEYTLNRYSMSSHHQIEGCEIGIGTSFTAFLDISSGKVTRASWDAITNSIPHRPLAGLGDSAYEIGPEKSNVPGATETSVGAIKGDTDCKVELIQSGGPAGAQAVVPKTHEEIVKRLAGLCEKIFAK